MQAGYSSQHLYYSSRSPGTHRALFCAFICIPRTVLLRVKAPQQSYLSVHRPPKAPPHEGGHSWYDPARVDVRDYYQLAGTNIYQPPVSGLHLQLTTPPNTMFALLDRAVSKSG